MTRPILLASQTRSFDDTGAEDVSTSASSANVLQLLKLPDGTVKVLVEGKARAQIEAIRPGRVL